jgi:pilus assembly protein CpaE
MMTGRARIVAVGAPQVFRQQVAWALESDPEQVDWVPSVTAAEEYMVANRGAADVLVLSPGVKDTDALGLAQYVTSTSPTTAVVLVRERGIGNGFLPQAMRSGIRDVVDLARGSHELRDALQRAVAWSMQVRGSGSGLTTVETPLRRGTVVSIFSSKGGTGKTFLVANLAAALAERSGQDTAIVDLELEMGDVFSYFGEDSRQTVQDMLAVGHMTNPDEIKAAGKRLGDHLWAYGVAAEPGTHGVPGEAIGKMLRAVRGTFGYTVVDSSANYSDHALASFDVADAVYLITGLDIVGVRHLSMALQTMLTLGLPRERFRIVLNRSDSKVGLEAGEVEKVLKVEVDARIPSSRLVPLSLNLGRPVYLAEPKSPVAKAIGSLADRIIESARRDESTPAPDTGKHRKPGLFRRG